MVDDAVVCGATKEIKEESRERRRNETPFERISIAKKEENRPISGKINLFPNPNTINNFMMAIDDHMRSSLVTSTAPFGTHATMNTTRQDSNKNGVMGVMKMN